MEGDAGDVDSERGPGRQRGGGGRPRVGAVLGAQAAQRARIVRADAQQHLHAHAGTVASDVP